MNTVRPPGKPSRDLADPPNEMRRIRIERGLSLREFARALQISPTSVQHHETENRDMGPEMIFRAAEILKVDPLRLDRKMREQNEKIAALTAKFVSQTP